MSSTSSAARRMNQLAAQMSTEATTAEPSVLFREHFASRVYTLNRPNKLNALDHDMIKALSTEIEKWDESDLCNVIVGTGKKHFCAGGDVERIVTLIQNPETRNQAIKFFRDEFMLNYRLSQLQKPYVAVMDGITMGGGVGLSMHAPFRIATERTLFAMPETDIGYFTDVGATHFLSHLDGHLGTYLALSSDRVAGRQVFECGIATHYVPSRNVPLLLERLSRLEGANHAVVNEAIDEFYEARTGEDPPPRLVGPIREAIDDVFSLRNPIDIMNKLEVYASGGGGGGRDRDRGGGGGGGSGNPKRDESPIVEAWAKETVKAIQDRSPTSVFVTREALFLAREKNLKSAFETEMRLAQAYCTDQTGDFVEGVTAKLIEKPKRQAKWNPETLSQVDPKLVEKLLYTEGPLPEGFQLETRGRPRKDYGLPKESEIKNLVESKPGMNVKELIERLEMDYKGKHGLKAKVLDVIERKTRVKDDQKLVWRRDE